MPDTLNFNNISIEIEPVELPSRLAEIQTETIRQVVEDPQKWIDAYYEKFGKKIVNSDDAKTLFPEYEADPLANVQGVHEASSILAKLIFRLRLAELPEGAFILLTAGGAASGKTHSAKVHIETADLVYDSVMKSAPGNRRLIEEIAAAGHIAAIIYIYRDVREAARSNILRSITHGRVVPFRVLAEGHYQSQRVFIDDTNAYAEEKDMDIFYIQNIIGKDPVELSLEEFKSLSYNSFEEVLQLAETYSYEEYEKNKERYDPRIPDALKGNSVGGL